MRHGTLYAYRELRCRCADCRIRWNQYMADLKLRRIEWPIPASAKHGTVATYNNWSCRCEPCSAAKRAANAAAYARRKAAV